MKGREKKDLLGRGRDELQKMLEAARNELFTLALSRERKKLKNVRAVFFKRKDIARISTILRGKELAQKQGVEEHEKNIKG